jgi:diaminohydroxyphosphoribosylaminopyrimidine deaminase / 5-amino-6-(5-phosphoribosylamino)uracil reductase
MQDDTNHMKAALNLARRGLGNVWPNPAVGCVITNNNRVVGRGWTMPGGRPHAETEALRRAGKQAKGATAYVTLEPCNHHGQTPPCSEALIEAGIKRVVVATQDPDKRVAGTGLTRLKAAGIQVEFGAAKSEADQVNQGFFSKVELSKPRVTLKIATTLDGKIATRSGESQWITGKSARRMAHKLRATHDAIMIGSGTALADNPALTCRIEGMENERRPRIVLDGRLRLPLESNLAQTAKDVPVIVFTLAGDAEKQKKIKQLQELGISVIVISSEKNGLNITEVVQELGSKGITRLFVEGGGTLAASIMSADLVDEIAWFRAPSVIGNDGISAIEGLGLDKLAEMPSFSRKSITALGEDCLEILSRKR